VCIDIYRLVVVVVESHWTGAVAPPSRLIALQPIRRASAIANKRLDSSLLIPTQTGNDGLRDCIDSIVAFRRQIVPTGLKGERNIDQILFSP